MNKRFFAMLMAFVMLSLCGCQLAQSGGGADRTAAAQTDQLVGVYITTEPLSSVDWDAWLEENADRIADGEIVLPEEGDAAQRFYAALTEVTVTNRDGTVRTEERYLFEGIDGMILANFRMGDPSNPNNQYHATDVGEGIQDVVTTLTAMDNGTFREVLGTICLTDHCGEMIFYFNPVYQSADGTVYLVSGNGVHIGSELGSTATHTLTGTMTKTENDVETTHTVKIEVKLDFVAVAEKIVLVQMDENNREIAREEFVPGQMPTEFNAEGDAAYLILEEHTVDGVVRTIYQRDCGSIGVFYTPDGKLCIKETISVNW